MGCSYHCVFTSKIYIKYNFKTFKYVIIYLSIEPPQKWKLSEARRRLTYRNMPDLLIVQSTLVVQQIRLLKNQLSKLFDSTYILMWLIKKDDITCQGNSWGTASSPPTILWPEARHTVTKEPINYSLKFDLGKASINITPTFCTHPPPPLPTTFADIDRDNKFERKSFANILAKHP